MIRQWTLGADSPLTTAGPKAAARIGSLTVGQDAGLVIWSSDPLDVMSRVERAFVDGGQIYRHDYDRREGPFADF
jgi:predicted amidohydrolase YtcJ